MPQEHVESINYLGFIAKQPLMVRKKRLPSDNLVEPPRIHQITPERGHSHINLSYVKGF